MDGIGVGIDNLIFNALGIKNAPRSDWTARRLFRTMASSNTLTLRGFARSGHAITAQFDLSELDSIYSQLPSQCRSRRR